MDFSCCWFSCIKRNDRTFKKIDHENALLLADELEKIPGIVVNKNDIHINYGIF